MKHLINFLFCHSWPSIMVRPILYIYIYISIYAVISKSQETLGTHCAFFLLKYIAHRFMLTDLENITICVHVSMIRFLLTSS